MLAVASKYWWVLLVRGLLGIGFGIGALAWPGLTILVLVVVFGVYSLLDGILDLGMAVGARSLPGSSRGALVLMGLFGIAAGIVAFLWPDITAVALLWVIAFWAITTGVFEIVAAIRLRTEINNEWFWILSGVLSVVLGVVLVLQPGVGALAVVTTIGVFAIVWGVSLTLLSFRVKAMGAGSAPTPRTA